MTQAAKPDQRKRDIQRIHILKSQLGLDDETYRGVLWAQATVHSSTELDGHGRRLVINHLEALVAKTGRTFPKRPHNVSAKNRGELKKIEALLTDAGKPWAYAEAMARHMYRKQRIAFCAPHELAGILAALEKAALKRLKSELSDELTRQGQDWPYAFAIAKLLFGFDTTRRELERYAETLSNVLRWLRGDLAPVFCERPINRERPQCCLGCAQRAGLA
ncbi:MAG: phage protein GemA/Gp16 family protein [Sinimarinibacterium flocculans]|uniref:phage protein GemA/Gp16 family protein n=1 Tax=Sinimarinibacterium flocculans TaxID=985250 RepID=UPI003C599C20